MNDPLNEDLFSPLKTIVHKYKNRVLFYTTNKCDLYCIFCTRKRKIKNNDISITEIKEGLQYIKEHEEISEVIISGGDPLTLGLNTLEMILSELKSFKHINIIRIGTRIPVISPYRITNKLTNLLKEYAPIYINIHVISPKDLTNEFESICKKLIFSGCILGSQTVLLKNINDNAEILSKMFLKLLKFGVKPYYLFDLDNVGSEYLRVDIKAGKKIIKTLRKNISGMAIPKYIKDTKRQKILLGG